MQKFWLVGLGGFLGSVLRYAVGMGVARWKGGSTFPLETLVVNVVGCLVIGLLAGVGDSRGAFSPAARAFLFVGLLGGFTTFLGLRLRDLSAPARRAMAGSGPCRRLAAGARHRRRLGRVRARATSCLITASPCGSSAGAGDARTLSVMGNRSARSGARVRAAS